MSAHNISSALEAFLTEVNLKRWDEVKKLLRTSLVYNELHFSNGDFVNHLMADVAERNITQLRVDGVAAHIDHGSLGARQVTRKVDPDGNQVETWALILVFFDDEGKISRFYEIDAPPNLVPPTASVAPIEEDPAAKYLSAEEMRDVYHAYINSYNDGTMPTVLPQKWAETVVMNGTPQRRDVIPAILGQILLPLITGLKYAVEEMVTDVEKQQVFVRLSLEGVPENKNLQRGADGKEKIKVYEHAMYGFLEGKIARVWASQGFDMTPP